MMENVQNVQVDANRVINEYVKLTNALIQENTMLKAYVASLQEELQKQKEIESDK
jgi:hypothetical protein